MLDWNKIDTVFLDMDGTLLDLHYDNYFWLDHLPARYAELKGLSPAETQTRLHQMYQEHHGTLNWYCLDFWADTLDVDIFSLKKEVADRVAYRPNARAFLQALKDHNYDVALVTNAHRQSLQVKLDETDLSDLISEMISSHDFQIPKEDLAFWQALQGQRHYDPARTVFFDDNEAVLKTAQESGIAHLVSIAKPDSQKPLRDDSEFILLHDFQDVFPIS